MSITTPLQPEDNGAVSRVKLNDNFDALEVAIEEVINDGAPLASTTVAGRSKLSVAPADAADPIAVGDNDPRLPDSDLQNALSGGGAFGTPSASNKFLTENFRITKPATDRIIYEVAGSPHTWTKKDGLKFILVQVWGSGASGAASRGTGAKGGGGGGGGYAERTFSESELSATHTVTVAAGGTARVRTTDGDTAGEAGGTSSFGSLLLAYGGGAGTTAAGGAGANSFGTTGAPDGGTAGSFGFNSGGGGTDGTSGGASIEGGGGGGGCANTGTTSFPGGASKYGGSGGASARVASGNVTATSGAVPAGGGGCAASASGGTVTSGAGGAGRIIVTEFYS
jgi:hypothetical protein